MRFITFKTRIVPLIGRDGLHNAVKHKDSEWHKLSIAYVRLYGYESAPIVNTFKGKVISIRSQGISGRVQPAPWPEIGDKHRQEVEPERRAPIRIRAYMEAF